MCNLEEIEQDIIERDYRDMHREIAPLKQAEDAVLVDTSDMDIDEVVDAIISVAAERGLDVYKRQTAYYEKGAEQALKLARLYHCEYAILKERSPSCGKGHIYDGTFTGTLVPGDGVTAALLTEHGIKVIGESRISQVFGNDKGGNSDELEEK